MMNLTDHTTDNRSIFLLYNLRNLVQTQRIERALLVNRISDLALNLLDFNCCHNNLLND